MADAEPNVLARSINIVEPSALRQEIFCYRPGDQSFACFRAFCQHDRALSQRPGLLCPIGDIVYIPPQRGKQFGSWNVPQRRSESSSERVNTFPRAAGLKKKAGKFQVGVSRVGRACHFLSKLLLFEAGCYIIHFGPPSGNGQ